MTDETLIAEAGRRLAAAAPDATVILFGSRARGEGRSDSDLDLLVIEPGLKAAARSSYDSVKLSAISAFRSTLWFSAPNMQSRGLGFAGLWSTRRCSGAAFLSERDPRAEAEVLVRKARDDANAVRLLAADTEISDEIVGFHAQQAVEKWLKAVLGSRGIEFETPMICVG
jgi:hypothetical protein